MKAYVLLNAIDDDVILGAVSSGLFLTLTGGRGQIPIPLSLLICDTVNLQFYTLGFYFFLGF